MPDEQIPAGTMQVLEALVYKAVKDAVSNYSRGEVDSSAATPFTPFRVALIDPDTKEGTTAMVQGTWPHVGETGKARFAQCIIDGNTFRLYEKSGLKLAAGETVRLRINNKTWEVKCV